MTLPSNLTEQRHRRGRVGAAVLAIALLTAACGDSSSSATKASTDDTSGSDATSGTAVSIETFMFMPGTLKLSVGDTITWTNNDSILHTVTSGERDYDPTNSGLVTATRKDGLFDFELDGKGATGTFTATTAGSFHYFCDRHPGMEADIEVS